MKLTYIHKLCNFVHTTIEYILFRATDIALSAFPSYYIKARGVKARGYFRFFFKCVCVDMCVCVCFLHIIAFCMDAVCVAHARNQIFNGGMLEWAFFSIIFFYSDFRPFCVSFLALSVLYSFYTCTIWRHFFLSFFLSLVHLKSDVSV